MDNIRVFLWLALLGTAWITYTAWVADYAPPPTPAQSPATPPADAGAGELPPLEQGAAPPPDVTTTTSSAPQPTGELIRVRTDVLDVAIGSQGGDLVRADLLQYPVTKKSQQAVRLLDDSAAEHWVFQSGVR